MGFVEMDFSELNELAKRFDQLADDGELREVSKRIVTQKRDIAAKRMKPKIRRSKNNERSGKKGYRPPGHAADNIPISEVKAKKGKMSAAVGWEKSDNSPYFYMKFVEWGTPKMPPRDFIYNTLEECWAEFNMIEQKEMQQFVDEKLSGV